MYIYIITHPKFEGWVKLGRAIDVKKRLNGYQTCCPNREYKLEYYIETEYIYNIETHFAHFVKGNKEWYQCSVDFAKKEIAIVLNKISKDETYFKYTKKNKGTTVQRKGFHYFDYIVDDNVFKCVRELSNYLGINEGKIFSKIKKKRIPLKRDFFIVDGIKVIRIKQFIEK